MTKSNSDYKTFHDIPVFAKKVDFEEESIDIGDKNNVSKFNVPTLTVFYVNQCRQTQKDIDKDVISYVNIKILAQVNKIKDPTPIEIEEAMNEDPESDVMCTYSSSEGNKPLGIPEELSSITILGDLQDLFFDSSFAGEKRNFGLATKETRLETLIAVQSHLL